MQFKEPLHATIFKYLEATYAQFDKGGYNLAELSWNQTISEQAFVTCCEISLFLLSSS